MRASESENKLITLIGLSQTSLYATTSNLNAFMIVNKEFGFRLFGFAVGWLST